MSITTTSLPLPEYPSSFKPIIIPPNPAYGGRLFLRSPTRSDAGDLLRRVQKPSVIKYIPGLRYAQLTLEDEEHTVTEWQEQTTNGDGLVLQIALARNELPASTSPLSAIGGIDLKLDGRTSIQEPPTIDIGQLKGRKIAELGIMLDGTSEVRGRGYAAEAMGMIIDYGFDVLELDEVRVRTLVENAAMNRVMLRSFGFDEILDSCSKAPFPEILGREEDEEMLLICEASLGRWYRYSKVMNDCKGKAVVEDWVREEMNCYLIERGKWRVWQVQRKEGRIKGGTDREKWADWEKHTQTEKGLEKEM